MLDNQQTITVTDYGAGSRVFKSAERKIKDIATYAGATHKRILLLQRLIAYFQPQEVLELGTSLGIATAALAIKSNAQVTSIEGCPQTAQIAQQELDNAGIKNVKICVGDFTTELDNHIEKNFDFIYFDGNHARDATINYVNKLLVSVNDESVWVFDDIHWSQEMTEAWEYIKALPQVTATVDAFYFGMVFFRPKQAKEDFYIKL